MKLWISWAKEAIEYVEDDRKLLPRICLCSVHNLVQKQKTFRRANLVHQGMSLLRNLMFFCSSLGNRIFEKIDIQLEKISECAGGSRASPSVRVREPRSCNWEKFDYYFWIISAAFRRLCYAKRILMRLRNAFACSSQLRLAAADVSFWTQKNAFSLRRFKRSWGAAKARFGP